jgi:hypothetical protein
MVRALTVVTQHGIAGGVCEHIVRIHITVADVQPVQPCQCGLHELAVVSSDKPVCLQ